MSSSEAEMPVAAEQAQARTATFTLFFPFIMGFATSAPLPEEGENRTVVPEGIVLINPFTGSLMMVSGNMEPPAKEGPLPASKASIEAMPAVKITEEGLECAICLAEYEVGGEAKEMPCKHRYHSECIEKWLGIHGTCPVCRYKMPVEESGENKKGGQGGEGENSGRRAGGEVRINFFFGGGGGDQGDSSMSPAANSVGGSSNDE
ncbi:hypothetical protein NMG60_11006439 [Bertholletia excelsa]